MPVYNDSFKAEMVAKMLLPNAQPVAKLIEQSGVSRTALYSWQARAIKQAALPKTPNNRRPDNWTAEQKLAALEQAAGLSDAELGAFLRERGLYAADLQRWRQQAAAGLEAATKNNPMMQLVEDAVSQGARREEACAATGVSVRTLQRWALKPVDERFRARQAPSNSLSAQERAQIVAVATSPEFHDASPKKIVPILADRGQ